MTKYAEIETESFTQYWPIWYSDSSYYILTLPGKKEPISWYDTADMVLKMAFFDKPIDVTGDFYIGIKTIKNETHNPDYARELPIIYNSQFTPTPPAVRW